jgi:hypothetical protein
MNDDPFWRSQSDEQLLEAANALSDYTEDGEKIIRTELRRRGLAQPPEPIGRCATCGRSLHANDRDGVCAQCGTPFPPDILARTPPDAEQGHGELIRLARFEDVADASATRTMLEAAGISAFVPIDPPDVPASNPEWVELLVWAEDYEAARDMLRGRR